MEFQFLRPDWLWALLPAIILPLWLWRSHAGQHGWQKHIDSAFLPYLQAGQGAQKRHLSSLLVLFALGALCAVALAGPTWERRAVPVEQGGDAMIIVVDLSLSMLSQDIAPSRISRAQMKVLDILNARQEGTTALVVYAGDAHVVTPLSDDSATLAAMVPALTPDIMPALGSRVDLGIEKALQIAQQAGSTAPVILLLSDGITANDVDSVSRLLDNSQASFGILGIGTITGGPVPLPNDQGLLRNRDGSIAVPTLSRDNFTLLASRTGGIYRDIQLGDSDWQDLIALKGEEQTQRESEREFDQWLDRGADLSLLLLLGLLPLFRRGIIFSLVLMTPLLVSPDTFADNLWENLWQRPDQRGQQLLEQGDAAGAAKTFEDPEWRAIAHFQAGNFDAAQKVLNPLSTSRTHYNRGNALAKSGQLEAAIEAYAQALEIDPEHEDAAFNKALVEELLKQQQEQQQEQQQQQQNQDAGEQNQDQDNNQQQDSQQGSPGDQQNDSQNEPQSDSQDKDSEQDDGQTQPSQPDENAQDSKNPDSSDQKSSDDAQQNEATPADMAEQHAANDDQAQAQAQAFEDLSDEEKQTMEQWLRQIPDDPGGLLRRKFRYQYEQRRLNGQQEVPETWY